MLSGCWAHLTKCLHTSVAETRDKTAHSLLGLEAFWMGSRGQEHNNYQHIGLSANVC